MRAQRGLLLVAGATILAGSATAQPAGQRSGPIATYWVSAQTSSGMMGAMGAGGRPNRQAMMSMMMGGGGGETFTHALTLQLGSQQRPSGAPSAEHLPPQGLGAGPSLPLVTPPPAAVHERTEEPTMPENYKPRGRMLIFWGCGEHARPGQPIVIDFSQMQPGQVPPGMAALTKGLGVTPMQPPSPSRSTTYGEWPNAQSRTTVPPEGSLVGQHTVRGDYSPEIRFTLNANQDFLAPLEITSNSKTPLGADALAWRGVPGALAYMATAIGGGRDDTAVMWSSSEVQASAFALPDYLSPGDINRLVANKALMGPQTTSCTIPKEVVDNMEGGLVQLAAYGGEANFAYPPRPADPKVRYAPDWVVKVRYKSTTGTMLGMSGMGAMGGGMQGADEDGPRRGPPPGRGQQQPRRPSAGDILRGLGGF